MKINKLLLKLGEKIEECKKHVFNQGYNYVEADKYVKLVFEETGLKFGLFDYVGEDEIKKAIKYLDNSILLQR